jgi:DNA-binding protein HU-beta
MNKNELAVQMVKDSSITKTEALNVIDAFVDIVTNEMKKNGKLTIVGFGTFKTIVKQKKKGRNPKTGAEIIIPKRKVVKFVPGKQLKDSVK